MRNLIMWVIILFVGMTSCAVNECDPLEQTDNIDALASFGAKELADNKIISTLTLDELPGMSASEVSVILSNIQKHSQSEKHYMVEENDHDGFCDVDILMDETINHKYTFTIQLHMERNNNSGVMYYKGFEADCTSNQFEWYIKGFSFSSDNLTGNNKFESPSYLYFKVLNEGVTFIQVPILVKGTYSPTDNKADFTYSF